VSEDKVKQTVQAISTLTKERGYPPTVREVQTHLGLSSSSVAHARIRKLQKRGLAVMDDNTPRSLRLVKDAVPF
jgi:repressor LexA